MSAVISESYLSRKFSLGQQAGRELVYDIQGTMDETEVQTLLLATAPGSYLGLGMTAANAEPLGGGVWKGYVQYSYIEDESEYTFDTTGGTQKRTQSIATLGAYAPSGLTAPDFAGAIGVSEDRVEGIDIAIGAFSCSETHRFAASFVDASYKQTLFQLTGTINNASFKGFDAGECLFLGASGTKRGTDLWSITYRFAGSPNATGVTVGSITGINKRGWDYLWVRYSDFVDSFAMCLVKKPTAAYVEQVYGETDFSLLGIGTT